MATGLADRVWGPWEFGTPGDNHPFCDPVGENPFLPLCMSCPQNTPHGAARRVM